MLRYLLLSATLLGLSLHSLPPADAQAAWPHKALLTRFVKNMTPVKLPYQCCKPLAKPRPIPADYAPLLETENEVWARDAQTWAPDEITGYQYGYVIHDKAPVTAVIVYGESFQNGKNTNYFELWSFHTAKGLVSRLEIAGKDEEAALGSGDAGYTYLATKIAPGLMLTTDVKSEFYPGSNPDGPPEKESFSLKYKLDPASGVITALK